MIRSVESACLAKSTPVEGHLRRGVERTCLLAGIIWGWASLAIPQALAQADPPPGDPPRPATVTVDEVVDSKVAQGTYARTLALSSDQEVALRWRGANTAFQIGNSTDGIRVLAELLRLPELHLVEENSTFRDIRQAVTDQLKSGTQELRDQFVRETTVQAAADLKEARANGDLLGLFRITNHYPFTPAAREASLLLATQWCDHGRYDLAIQAAERWIEGAPAPDLEAKRSGPLLDVWYQATLASRGRKAAQALSAKYAINSSDAPHKIIAADDAPEIMDTAQMGAGGWTVESPLPPGVDAILGEISQLLRRNGDVPRLSSQPLIVGDQLLWRSPTELICLRPGDGSILWRAPLEEPLFVEIEQSQTRRDANREQRLKSQLAHRLLRDSIHSRLTTDSQRVFSIEAAPDWIPPSSEEKPESSDQEPAVPIQAQTIVARSLATGEVLWKSHEVWDAGHQLITIYGPPTVRGQTLFAIIQQNEQLMLARIDASTGRLEGASLLGECPHPSLDRRRLTQASPLVWNGKHLICSTGVGAVVAFDLYAGQIAWAYRHPRQDNLVAGQLFGQPMVGGRGWQWFHDCHEAQLVLCERRLIYLTPEAQFLRCLDAESGALQWELPRAESSAIVGTLQSQILVQSNHSITAIRLKDGQVASQLDCVSPIHTVTWQDDLCQIVEVNGSQTQWNPRTGSTRFQPARKSWGQLVAPAGALRPITPGQIAEPAGYRVVGSQTLKWTTHSLDYRSDRDPRLPNLNWEKEAPATLVTRLSDWIQQVPVDERRARTVLALEEMTNAIEQGRIPDDSQMTACWSWSLDEADRIELTWRLLQQALATQRYETAIGYVLSLAEQKPQQWELNLDDSSAAQPSDLPRTVRLDAAIRGVLQRVWLTAPGSEWGQQKSRIETWSSRPEAVAGRWSQPFELLSFLSISRSTRPLDSLASLATLQMAFMHDALHPDPTRAATALARLAELQIRRGEVRYAASLLQRLQERFRDVSLPGPISVNQLLPQLAGGTSLPEWPNRKPIVSVKTNYAQADYVVPLQIRAERGTPFDRIGVSTPGTLDRQVRFSLDGKLSWETSLPPTSIRNLHGDRHLRRGWAIGQFLVLQYGSELYCLSSRKLDEASKSAKTRDRFVWPRYEVASQAQGPQQFVDTLGNEDNRLFASQQRDVKQYIGFNRPETELVDAHGRRRTWVGPVAPEISCFLQQGMLVCLETATGSELWRRYDLPGGVRTYGDDDAVAVVFDDSRDVELLSPLDGRLLLKSVLKEPGEILYDWGRHLLLAQGQPVEGTRLTAPATKAVTPPPTPAPAENVPQTPADPAAAQPVEEALLLPAEPLRLAVVDLKDQATVWSREYPAGSACFEIDEEWLGVLHAAGRIEFLDRRTGQLVRETEVAIPAGINRISATVTDQLVLVALSNGPRESKWRWPMIQGPLYAFDRQAGQLLWKKEIESRGLPLEQPRNLPLIMLVDTFKQGKGTLATANSRFLILDSRTGETIHEMLEPGATPRYRWEKDQATSSAQLILSQQKVRYDFAQPKQ